MKHSISGLQDVRKVLNALPGKVQTKVVKNALRAGARVIRNEIRTSSRVPVLARTVTVKTTSKKERARTPDLGDVHVAFRAPGNRLAALFEFGTGPRVQKTTGRYTGRIPATPTVRPAFYRTRDQVIGVSGKSLGKGVEREATRLAATTPKKTKARK